MATLTRPKQLSRPASTPLLTSAVPAPFPRNQLIHSPELGDASSQLVATQAGPSRASETEDVQASESHSVLQEVMPSIVHVQKSCLMTLNNLLSMPTRWNPIVPDRRHSMPSSPQASTTSEQEVAESSSALQTLVTNLRNREVIDDMIEVAGNPTESQLLHELRTRVEGISPSLEPGDALLAHSLVSLLSHIHRLSTIQSNSSQLLSGAAEPVCDTAGPSDLFAMLKRQLSGLQVERLSTQPEILGPGAPPVLVVEAALLWNKIDEDLEKVVAMCKERTESLSRFPLDSLPPQYDPEDYELDTPPEYHESGVRTSIDSKSRNPPHSPITASRQMDEKMRLDLEGVAMAIDRLYLVAPQLHNQRVELKSSKLAQMEKASREGTQATQTPQSRSGKQKEGDVQELEAMLELLGKASERSLSNQSVILEGGLPARLEKARQKDIAKRDALVEQLVNHSAAGRLHGQDAILPTRTKNPNALLSLPEFIRESVPTSSIRADPRALLTLPEFVKESPPPPLDEDNAEISEIPPQKEKKRHRHRSLSAPSLSWLRSASSSKSGSSSSGGLSISHSRSRSRGMNALPTVPNVGFEVNYVAENHENLQHVLVFFTVTGATPGVDIEAAVMPPFPESQSEGGDRLIISSGPRRSLPLLLPARTLPGKQEVRVQSGHYEIKLTTLAPRPSPETNEDPPPLLDAAQLSAASPTSFICASCSLPLVQSTKIGEYRDLPSEHWEELVDTWMCHTDQKLHDQVVKQGKGGFWPHPGQALVGGSYILFEGSSMTLNNLHVTEEPKPGEDWRLARCLCGAVLGRCQDHSTDDEKLTVFRLLKYAIRPVSLTSEPLKIPLSAFIVEDMIEFVRAHATYRFVILDEEQELPRILVWLFKPSIRLAYTTSSPYAIAKSANIHAAKVLFKILTPAERTADLKSILTKYPGFPQAEYLSYPMPVCRRLAGLLNESNTTYPETLRVMTGLQVGWLYRV